MKASVSSVLLALGLLFRPGQCIPKRGNEPWSVILCKFKNSHYEPRTAEWIREWISAGNNPDTVESFFSSVSNGLYDIKGSNVTEWLKLPWSRHDVYRMALTDRRLQSNKKEKPFALFDKAKQLCISFAQLHGYELNEKKITIINSEQTAVYGNENGVLLSPKLIFTSVLAHEMVHSLNIGHSYSDRYKRYDDAYDLMSTANAHMRPSTYGLSGPGLNGPHLNYLGWLPMDRIIYFGRDGQMNRTISMSSLSVPHRLTSDSLLILIPYDRDEPANVYTVEYRTVFGNDASIGSSGILIHKVEKFGDAFYSHLITYVNHVYDELTAGTEWISFLHRDEHYNFQYIRVKVENLQKKLHSAEIRVISTFDPSACRKYEQRIATERKDTVDSVCLRHNRAITYKDIEVQRKRNLFYKLRATFGQNECHEGMRWRAIDAYDYVCVIPERVAIEQVTSWRKKKRHSFCYSGQKRRRAFEGDNVCVSSEEFERTQKENMDAYKYLKHLSFFNGQDKIRAIHSALSETQIKIMSTTRDRAVLSRILNPLMPSEDISNNNDVAVDKPIEHEGYAESKELEKQGVRTAEGGDVNAAIEIFTRAISTCDINPSAYNNRAQAYRLVEKNEEALADLNRAIELSEEQGKSGCQAFVQRAMIHRLKGDDDAARADFEKAANLGSSFAKLQLVALNPYAAMCNKMLSEVFQNLREGKECQESK
ncbi:hypothetical protein WR25_03733 [Diploscapter pachys]|uniref:Uncharacterized protein n=1 Tax=Diploscapter pachys TaxID=2018661 RepID=A0A2A2LN92_9BILA|nr:hypothetical protein WR25_03733 [Diploscapter pachys]